MSLSRRNESYELFVHVIVEAYWLEKYIKMYYQVVYLVLVH